MGKYDKLLKNSNFKHFFTGRIISSFGDKINFIAIMLYVFALTGRALDVSLFMICNAIPKFLIMPFAGVVADKYDKKRLLIFCDIARALLVVMIPFCGQLYQIFILSILISSFNAISFPTRQAFYPTLVEKDDLMLANSLNSVLMSIVTLVGFAAGGAIVGFLGAKIAFVVDGATFLISGVLLLLIKVQKVASNKEPLRPKEMISNIKEGANYCIQNHVLKFALVFIFTISLMVSMVDPMIVSYTKQSLHLVEMESLKAALSTANESSAVVIQEAINKLSKQSDLEFSIIFVLVGIGGILGTYVNGKFAQNVNRLKALMLMTVFDGICLIGIGRFPNFYVSTVLFTVWGVVATLFQVYLFTMIQESAEQKHMGKVFGLVGVIRDPAAIVSYIIGGMLADLSSPALVISVIGGIEILICFVLMTTVLYKLAKKSIDDLGTGANTENVV